MLPGAERSGLSNRAKSALSRERIADMIQARIHHRFPFSVQFIVPAVKK
jgi:hypothetical protein